MQRRVLLMANAEQEHLPIQIVDTADRAFRPVGRQGQGIGSDAPGLRTGRGAGERMVASQDSGRAARKCPRRFRGRAKPVWKPGRRPRRRCRSRTASPKCLAGRRHRAAPRSARAARPRPAARRGRTCARAGRRPARRRARGAGRRVQQRLNSRRSIGSLISVCHPGSRALARLSGIMNTSRHGRALWS